MYCNDIKKNSKDRIWNDYTWEDIGVILIEKNERILVNVIWTHN